MGTFEKLPSDVLARRDISPAAKIVYAFMRPLVAKGIPVGQRLVADRCGVSKTMVLRAIRELVDVGLLLKTDAGNGRRASYSLPENRSTDGPLSSEKPVHGRTATGPRTDRPPVHGRTGSGPSTDHDQTPDLPDHPESARARSIVNFDPVPDPLGERPEVSVDEYVLRIWAKAGRNRGMVVARLQPRERQQLEAVSEWARAAAVEVANERGIAPADAFRIAVSHSLKAFAEEYDGKRRWAEERGAKLPAWRAGWWAGNLGAYSQGLLGRAA